MVGFITAKRRRQFKVHSDEPTLARLLRLIFIGVLTVLKIYRIHASIVFLVMSKLLVS
jgi:hypothetical protein